MTVHDGQRLSPALEDAQKRGIQPHRLLGDSHYGSEDNVALARQRQVELVSPAMPPKGSKQNLLTLEDFDLDERGCIRRCPAGHAPLTTSIGEVRIQARFDRAQCQRCTMNHRCPVKLTSREQYPRFQYTPGRVRLRTRRLQDKTEAFKEQYRWRAGVEGTMSRLKYQMNLIHLRVRGLAAVTYRVFLRALGLNILRCGHAMVA